MKSGKIWNLGTTTSMSGWWQGAFFILVIADVEKLSHRRNILYFDLCPQSGVLRGLYKNIDCSSCELATIIWQLEILNFATMSWTPCKISADCVMSSWSGLWSTSPVNQGLPWSRAPPFVRQTTRSHIALYNFTLYFCTQQQVAKHTCVLVYHRCISICIYICFCICTVSTCNINSKRPLVLVQHWCRTDLMCTS